MIIAQDPSTEGSFLIPFAIIVFILCATALAGRGVFWMTKAVNVLLTEWIAPTTTKEAARRGTLILMIGRTLRSAVWALGFILIAIRIGVPTPVLTVMSAVLGAGIGFGSQTIFADLIAGVRFIIERQASVGDAVELDVDGRINFVAHVAGVSGISLKVVTERGETIVVPHHSIRLCRNLNDESGQFTIDIPISDAHPAREVNNIVGVAVDHLNDQFSGTNTEVELRGVSELRPGCVMFQLYGQTEPGNQFAVMRDIRLAVMDELQQSSISLAEPVVVH